MDYGNEQLKKLKENRSKLASNTNLTAAEEPDEQADFIQQEMETNQVETN